MLSLNKNTPTSNIEIQRVLPSGPLNMGYAPSTTGDSDAQKLWRTKIINAVEKGGMNVIFWFSIIIDEEDGKPIIKSNSVQPLASIEAIVDIVAEIRKKGFPVTHMVTLGGWSAQHPPTKFSAIDVWNAWKSWNKQIAKAGLINGFDGIDWDIEGADQVDSPSNHISVEIFDLVGKMSQYAKQDGFIVSLVPPESYLDPTTSLFNDSLLNSYPEWSSVDFKYHGNNCYAYLLAKYGSTYINMASKYIDVVDTFDIISIQVYETYSHMDYYVNAAPIKPVTSLSPSSNQTSLQTYRKSASQYLIDWIPLFYKGWYVDFETDLSFGIPSQKVRVNPSNLCIGLANGWADNVKGILVMPDEIKIAYNYLKDRNLEPRGFVYWAIDYDGITPPGQKDKLNMAESINKILLSE